MLGSIKKVGAGVARQTARGLMKDQSGNTLVTFANVASLIMALVALSFIGAVQADDAASEMTELTTIQCKNFSELKAHYKQTFIEPMISWSKTELADTGNRPVLYLFSGPDVVTALSLFPNAPHVTLVADQIPEYQLLEKGEKVTDAAEKHECEMLDFFARVGFYKTNELNGREGARPRFIKLLTYSIGFAGANLTDVSVLTFNASGDLVSEGHNFKTKPVGLRFNAVRDDGRPVVIDYLTINLANGGLAAHPMSVNYLKQNLNDVMFLKSASHLLQSPHFTVLADLIEKSPPALVVQDETGLSVRALHGLYATTLYGRFTDPQRIWANDPEARAFIYEFATHAIKAQLPFRLGYEKKAGSALIVGRHAATKTAPANSQSSPHSN